MDTLLTETGAHNVFGLSSGGLIALQAALELPSVLKVVVNEPPLDVDNSIITMPQSFMPRFDREIADGKVAEAMVTLLKDFGALFLPRSLQPVVNIAPRSVLVWLFRQLLRRDAEPFHAKPSAEYDRVASMALRVFHETASSSIPTEGKLKPPSL